jgi:ribose-phosphate pyrophosphokinase
MMMGMTKPEVESMIAESVSKANLYPIKIFGLNATKEYAGRVAGHLGIPLTPHEEKKFDDGESFLKSQDGPEGNVRGHKVFVIQSLYSDAKESVSDKFVKLCIMCGALHQASAYEVVPVILHLAWSRQDRKTTSRAPISTKIIAKMLQSTGISRVLLMDVHNLSAEQNAFDIPMDNLESKSLHAAWCAKTLEKSKKVVVLSPDSGGLARATRFRNALAKAMAKEQSDIGVVVFDKLRDPKSGSLSGGKIVGDVDDADVIVIDDMISTAKTAVLAGKSVSRFGGRLVAICATHGLFVGDANKYLDEIECPVVIADTIEPFRLSPSNREKVVVLDTSEVVANAIWRIHSVTGSISELLR